MGHDDPEPWNRFVQNKVADVCKWSVYSNLEKNVHDQIKCLSGDYLTVVLYLEQVSRLRVISTPAAIKQRLSDLPREKEKVYRDHVNRLAKTDHKLLEWSGHALSWIAHAFRPLTIQELSVAVAISQDGQNLSKDSVRENIPMKMWEDLDRHLGLFVQRHDQKVLLFHQTTKEFLLSCGSLGGQGKENELNLLSHAKLAGLCLDYMSAVFSTSPIVGDSSTPLEQPQDPPTDDIVDALLDYAAEYWSEHYRYNPDENEIDNNGLDEHTLTFLRNPGFRKKLCDILLPSAPKLTWPGSSNATELEIACELGLTGVVRRLVEKNDNSDRSQEELVTSLDLAIRNRHAKIVDLLLNAGARSKAALHSAARSNDVDIISKLLEYEKDINAGDNRMATALYVASECGSLEAAEILIKHGADASRVDSENLSPLDRAAAEGHIEIVSLLLQHHRVTNAASLDQTEAAAEKSANPNATVNQPKENNCNALDIAAKEWHAEVVRLLLDAGTEATTSALESAAGNGDLDVVQILIQKLGSQATSLNDSIALHRASEIGHPEIVQILLDAGVPTDSKDENGRTALHRAAGRGHTDIVEFLLRRSAEKNASDREGMMPCHLAAKGGHIATFKALQGDSDHYRDDLALYLAVESCHFLMVKYLLSLEAIVTVLNKNDKSADLALETAASKGYLAIVREFCEAGLDINRHLGTISPLHNAASKGHDKVVSYLIDNGARVNAWNRRRQTPLHQSVAYPQVVRILLSKGSSPNADDINGKRPLHLAVVKKCEDSVELLLKHSADVDAADDFRRTALHQAAEIGSVPIINLLLDKKAQVNAKTFEESTPLRLATKNCHEEVIKSLLDRGADVNAANDYGSTPLHLAAEAGKLNIVQLLLDRGADVNAIGESESTPLHLATKGGNPSVVKILLDAGVNVNHQNEDGDTALDNAKHMNDVESIKLLRAALDETKKGNQEDSSLTIATDVGSTKEMGLVDP
jgi:ankyrin repeat protein